MAFVQQPETSSSLMKSPDGRSESTATSAFLGELRPSRMREIFKAATMARILIGPERETRDVPKQLLTANSPFFQAALNGPFQEGFSQRVELPDDRVDAFDFFVYWLYTRRLDHEQLDVVHPNKPAYFRLINLYCLADKFQINNCKNDIVDKMIKLSQITNSVPTPQDTLNVFNTYEAVEENKMRKLVVDLFAWMNTDGLLDTHVEEWHPRFMRDLVVRLKRTDVREIEAPWCRDTCSFYHEHSDGRRCG